MQIQSTLSSQTSILKNNHKGYPHYPLSFPQYKQNVFHTTCGKFSAARALWITIPIIQPFTHTPVNKKTSIFNTSRQFSTKILSTTASAKKYHIFLHIPPLSIHYLHTHNATAYTCCSRHVQNKLPTTP